MRDFRSDNTQGVRRSDELGAPEFYAGGVRMVTVVDGKLIPYVIPSEVEGPGGVGGAPPDRPGPSTSLGMTAVLSASGAWVAKKLTDDGFQFFD